MKGRFYRVTRDLHLYLGLFISPFVLVFSISVFLFVHSWTAKLSPDLGRTQVVRSLVFPTNLSNLSGRPLINAIKPLLATLNIAGEIGFIQNKTHDGIMIVPISIPGRSTTLTLDFARSEATILIHETGLADAMMTLHKSPAGHAPEITMNWFMIRVWRYFADATAYLTLFISVSGVYLWYVLRAERRIGFILLSAGTLTFFAMAYAISF